MKIAIQVLVLMFSLCAWARPLNWDELEFGQKYHLVSDIPFTTELKLNEDDGLVLIDRGSGPGFVYFVFNNLMCTDTKLKSEMVLFNPDPYDTTDDKSIGVKLDENCEVGMYIELRLFYSVSPFK